MKLSLHGFLLLWGGQAVSLIGSELTAFALGVWVYQQTGSPMQFTLITICTLLPEVALAPLAGALVDRWDRRNAMILSDSGAGLSTLALAFLVITSQFKIWHLYLLMTVRSMFHGLQWPAYSAATTLLVPKQHLSRAHGMWEGATASARILAPLLGGVLITTINLQGVILIDFATFLFAVATLVIVQIPKPERTTEGAAGKGSLFREAVSGWTYVMARPGLRELLSFVATSNLFIAIPVVLITPLMLSFATPAALGVTLSSGGVGYLVGGVVLSVWGGPKRLVYGVIGGYAWRGLCCIGIGMTLSSSLIALIFGLSLLSFPMQAGCSQAIWQKKVAPDLQGRVFAVRRVITQSSVILSRLLGGGIAEYLFEPLLATGGPLAHSIIGRIIGIGPGRGIALLHVILGLLVLVNAATSMRNPRLIQVEEKLPDAV